MEQMGLRLKTPGFDEMGQPQNEMNSLEESCGWLRSKKPIIASVEYTTRFQPKIALLLKKKAPFSH